MLIGALDRWASNHEGCRVGRFEIYDYVCTRCQLRTQTYVPAAGRCQLRTGVSTNVRCHLRTPTYVQTVGRCQLGLCVKTAGRCQLITQICPNCWAMPLRTQCPNCWDTNKVAANCVLWSDSVLKKYCRHKLFSGISPHYFTFGHCLRVVFNNWVALMVNDHDCDIIRLLQ